MKEYEVVMVGPTWTKDFFVPHPTEPDVLSVKTWVVFSPHTREPIDFKARHDFSFLLHK
jgi:hypothetical protein